MLEKLFEAIDSKVLDDNLKADLEGMFNEQVEIKSTEIASRQIEEEKEKLEESYSKMLEDYKESLEESIGAYIEYSVNEMVKEMAPYLLNDVEIAKTKSLQEAYDAALKLSSVKIADIINETDTTKDKKKIENITSEYNKLFESHKNLEKKYSKMLRIGIMQELKEGLSLVEQEKFDKAADLINFDDASKYYKNLESLKEAIINDKPKQEKLNESKKDSDGDINISRLKHLI